MSITTLRYGGDLGLNSWRKPYGRGCPLPPIFMIEDLTLPLVLLVIRLIQENKQLKRDLAKYGEVYAQECDFFERESVLAENREDVDNLVMLGDTDLDINEYDTDVAQSLNDLLFRRYFQLYSEYFDDDFV